MAKRMNPLEKELLIRLYKENPAVKASDFCRANGISISSLRKWISQYDEAGLEGLAKGESLPSILPDGMDRSEENYKRFIYTKIPNGNTYEKKDAIEYLVQAHIVSKVFNLEVPSLPLKGARIESQFKLFPEDIGIVTSMYGVDTIAGINRGDLGQGQGAIFEAVTFDSLNKAGLESYYFAKESGLEIDFVISYNGFPTLVEARAKNGNAKSSKTVMKNSDHYGKTKLIKIGDYNISENGDIITIPHYLTFALGKLEYGF